MAGIAPESLSVAEAKARLRTAASDIETDFAAFTFAAPEPRRAVLLALLAGILAGSSAESRKLLARVLIGVLFDADS